MDSDELHRRMATLTGFVAASVVPGGRSTLKEMAHLQPAIKAATQSVFPMSDEKPCKVAVPGWLPRSPGPFDFAIGLEDQIVYGEAKVDELGWTLWDAIKLACVATTAQPGYLMVACWKDCWERKPLASLYTVGTSPQEHFVADLIEEWSDAWADLLVGGRGIRPKETPDQIRTAVVASARVSAFPDWELRCLAVHPVGDGRLAFDESGWPDRSANHRSPAGAIAYDDALTIDERVARLRTLLEAHPEMEDEVMGYREMLAMLRSAQEHAHDK